MSSITILQNLPYPDDEDLLYITDMDGGFNDKPRTKKMTIANLFNKLSDSLPDGVQGERGEQGERGDDGENGLSAYEIWLLLGNSGTEDEFIASLKGEQGIQGLKGEQGIGIQGLKGEQGIGIQRLKGEQGIQGLKGDKGDKGDTGVVSPFLFFNPTRYSVTNTTALTKLWEYTIPGNTLSANSILSITCLLGMSNNTNAKTFRCRVGTTDIFSSGSQITGYTSVLYQKNLVFRNSISSQILVPNDVNAYSRFTNPIQEFGFNFAQDQVLSFHAQPSVLSDSMSLEYVYAQVIKL